jgi:hypothetical protein
MMKPVKIGWKKLSKILNDVIKDLNRQKEIQGEGISLNETASGTIISVIPPAKDDDQAGMNAGQWTPVSVIDPTTCKASTVYMWTLPPPK